MAKRTISVCVKVTFWEHYDVDVEEREDTDAMEQEANDIALSMASYDFCHNPRKYPDYICVDEEI